MAPDGIVEGVDIASNRVLSLITCVEDGAPGEFPFQVRKLSTFSEQVQYDGRDHLVLVGGLDRNRQIALA